MRSDQPLDDFATARGGANGFAALVRQRSSGEVKRRELDDYETPADVTHRLLDHVALHGPVLEPACGSGRMVRALRSRLEVEVLGRDIKQGHDFLRRTQAWPGDIVTNPPYRNGLDEGFVRHALALADGRVCMLLKAGFLWGSARAANLYAQWRPSLIIIVPERIYFFVDGQQLTSQFYNHCWLVWPNRGTREGNRYHTKTVWGDRPDGVAQGQTAKAQTLTQLGRR